MTCRSCVQLRPFSFQITILGKLFMNTCLLPRNSINWYRSKGGDVCLGTIDLVFYWAQLFLSFFTSLLCERVYGIQSSSICSSPSFAVFCCSFYVHIRCWQCEVTRHIQPFPFATCFTFHSRLCDISQQNILSKNMPKPSMFLYRIVFGMFFSTFAPSNTEAFVTLSVLSIFSIFLQIQTSKASNLFLSALSRSKSQLHIVSSSKQGIG